MNSEGETINCIPAKEEGQGEVRWSGKAFFRVSQKVRVPKKRRGERATTTTENKREIFSRAVANQTYLHRRLYKTDFKRLEKGRKKGNIRGKERGNLRSILVSPPTSITEPVRSYVQTARRKNSGRTDRGEGQGALTGTQKSSEGPAPYKQGREGKKSREE